MTNPVWVYFPKLPLGQVSSLLQISKVFDMASSCLTSSSRLCVLKLWVVDSDLSIRVGPLLMLFFLPRISFSALTCLKISFKDLKSAESLLSKSLLYPCRVPVASSSLGYIVTCWFFFGRIYLCDLKSALWTNQVVSRCSLQPAQSSANALNIAETKQINTWIFRWFVFKQGTFLAFSAKQYHLVFWWEYKRVPHFRTEENRFLPVICDENIGLRVWKLVCEPSSGQSSSGFW